MVLLMALCFYITGFFKNLLCLPRPPSPPVIPLQRCQDWSLPSHHAVLNVNVPWFIWFYAIFNYSMHLPAQIGLFVFISIWSLSVILSRIYLGVHSPADILSGVVLGCIVLAIWLQCYEWIDTSLSDSPSLLGLFGVVFLVILLLYLHPDPLPLTIIFAETVCMTGVAMGFVIGHVLTPPLSWGRGLLEERHNYSSLWTIVVCSVVRFLLGLLVLCVAKALAEKVVTTSLKQLGHVAGVTTVCIKRKSEVTTERVHFSEHFIVQVNFTRAVSLAHFMATSLQMQDGGREWSSNTVTRNQDKPINLDIPVKLLSYTCMGMVAVTICPTLFSWANL